MLCRASVRLSLSRFVDPTSSAFHVPGVIAPISIVYHHAVFRRLSAVDAVWLVSQSSDRCVCCSYGGVGDR